MAVVSKTQAEITQYFTDIAKRIPLAWRYQDLAQSYDFSFRYKINYYKEAQIAQMTSGIERLKFLTECVALDDSRLYSMDTWFTEEITAIQNYIENYIAKELKTTYSNATDILTYDLSRIMADCASGAMTIKSNNIIASGFTTEFWSGNTGAGTFSNVALTQLAKAGKIYRLECTDATTSGSEIFSITEELFNGGTGKTLALTATAGTLFTDTEDYTGLVFQLDTTVAFAVGDLIWIKIDGENNSWFMSFFVDNFQSVLPNAASGAETISDSLIDLSGVS